MEHEQKMMAAFAKILKAEEAEQEAKLELSKAEERAKGILAKARLEAGDALREISSLMKETGEYEVILPGEVTDFKIGYGATRESVKVEDPEAVPDRFCKMERKPMLKEIGEHLKSLPESERPNWARIERPEPKLGWKAVKKTARTKE
jgi:hypothetical protein